MGDRGNVAVKSAEGTVFLYTHWSGTELPVTVGRALNRGRGRWGDAPYLTRIIFSEMLLDAGGERALHDETGFGIGLSEGDTNHPLIIVDDVKSTVTVGDSHRWTYEEFIVSVGVLR